MTGVAAYLTLTVVVPALLLGHQGQDWPLRGAWRRLQARMPRAGRQTATGAPEDLSRDSSSVGRAPEAAQRRTAPRRAPLWAHTQPIDYQEAA